MSSLNSSQTAQSTLKTTSDLNTETVVKQDLESNSGIHRIFPLIGDAFKARNMAVDISNRLEQLVYLYADWRLRKTTKRYTQDIQPCGNYYIDVSCVNQHDIVYSCGVGKNIEFDEALHEAFGCDIHMFDPTPVAIKYMTKFMDRPYLKFYPWGIWTEDKTMPFYFKKEEKSEQQNLSVTNLFQTSKYLVFDCYSLSSIMKRLSHNRIDILKMDIEGTAMPVLEKLMESDICPRQMMFELEKGRTPLLEFHKRLHRLLQQIKSKGYSLYFQPRQKKTKYNFQFLAVL